LAALYQLPAGDFHDTAPGTGGNAVTGLGTPVANYLVRDLVQGVSVAAGTSADTATVAAPTADQALPPPSPPESAGTTNHTFATSGVVLFVPMGVGILTDITNAPAGGAAPLPIAGPARTITDTSPGGISVPRLVPVAADGVDSSAPLSSGQPWTEPDLSVRDRRREASAPLNLGDLAGDHEADAVAWRRACDASFAQAGRQADGEDQEAALLLRAEDSGPKLSGAAGLASLAFFLVGAGAPAEPRTRTRRFQR
jgi:hypothetical protein